MSKELAERLHEIERQLRLEGDPIDPESDIRYVSIETTMAIVTKVLSE